MKFPKSIIPESSALEPKKSEEDLKSPEFYLGRIKDALEMLRFHGYRQEKSEGICVDPVYKAIEQLGDAVEALQKLGREVPPIDLSGLPEEFISSMDIHPATAGVAELLRQMKLKESLIEKWGTKEERSKRLKSNSKLEKKLP